ncbi:MAG TPA: site-specific integrase [Candidatus Cybelea sp.]|jgi:integrase|nr:site-specific integrase [Candidatus Cybelea sp.]
MRRKKARANPGNGSVCWNEKERRYVAQISLGFDDRGNRDRRRLVGPRNDKSEDAFYGLKDKMEQLRRKQPPRKRGQVSSRMTLREYLRTWLDNHTLSEAGHASYTWALEQYLIPHIGDEKLHRLDHERLRVFFSTLTGLSPASKSKIRTVLHKALEDALDKGLIIVNPASKLDVHDRASKYRPKEIVAWDREEAAKFLRAVERSEHLPMFLIMIRGALGPAETFGIQWHDIQLDRGWVSIVRNLTEVAGTLCAPKDVKEQSRRRGFRIPPVALRALRARHKRLRPTPSDYVFTSPDGGPIHLSNFRHRVWLPILKKAKVRPIRLYALRHSSASLMAAMGIPILLVSRAMGHADIKMTANVYSHLFDDAQEAVDEKFDAFFARTFKKRRVA